MEPFGFLKKWLLFFLPSGESASGKLEKTTWRMYPCLVRNFPCRASVFQDVLTAGWMKEITLASAAVVTSSDRRFPLKPGVPSFDALFVRWVRVPLAGVKAGTPVHRGLHNRALCSLYISKLKDDRQAHEQRDTQAGEKKERRTASVCQASEERDWDAAATNQQTLKRERGGRGREA